MMGEGIWAAVVDCGDCWDFIAVEADWISCLSVAIAAAALGDWGCRFVAVREFVWLASVPLPIG